MIIRLFLRFDGTDYNGWQLQNINGEENSALKTVQGTLNRALRTLLRDDNIAVVGSSRTDAGVHAAEYCASFETEKTIVPPDKIAAAVAHLLPEDIVVYRSEQAPEGFNARFDTKSKTYRYFFYTGAFSVPLLDRNFWHVPVREALDISLMNEAAGFIMGTHDFSAFCGSGASNKTAVRTVSNLRVESIGSMWDSELYAASITGDGFLYNMVRIITGTLIMAGTGKIKPSDLETIIGSRDRRMAGITAPPQGLHLWRVEY